MKFRLKHIKKVGWFAQVNPEEHTYGNDKSFFSKWYTLEDKGEKFYPEEKVDTPVANRAQAVKIIEDYKSSLVPKYVEVEYFEL